jgi:hypothetical protein
MFTAIHLPSQPLLRRTRCPANCSPCPAFAARPNIALKDRSRTNKMGVVPVASKAGAEEIPMYQRALPVTHPPIAPGARLGARKPLKARTLFRGFVEKSLRLLRSLGEFFAAGGPLS